MQGSRRAVAVKVLTFPASEHKRVRRVIRECQLSSAAQHPNVVASYSHFTSRVRQVLATGPGTIPPDPDADSTGPG